MLTDQIFYLSEWRWIPPFKKRWRGNFSRWFGTTVKPTGLQRCALKASLRLPWATSRQHGDGTFSLAEATLHYPRTSCYIESVLSSPQAAQDNRVTAEHLSRFECDQRQGPKRKNASARVGTCPTAAEVAAACASV